MIVNSPKFKPVIYSSKQIFTTAINRLRSRLSNKLKFCISDFFILRLHVSTCLNFFFITFIFLFFTVSYGQVKIKERVEINPKRIKSKPKIINKTQAQSHTIRLEYKWEQSYIGTKPQFGFRFRIGTPFCSDNRKPDYNFDGGTLTYEINNPLGTTYDFTLEYVGWSPWTKSYQFLGELGDYFDVYVDGEHYAKFRGDGFIAPWFGYLGIDLHKNSIGYYYPGVKIDFYTTKDCSPIIGNLNEDWPTITIAQGQEYLSFYLVSTDDTIGDSFYSEDYLDELPVIINDNPYYKNSTQYGVIAAELNGVIAKDSIKIIKDDNFELEVKTSPEDIKTGETTNILLKQIQFDGTKTDFEIGQLFNVEIYDGTQFGTLVAPNGIDTADSFTQIEQGFKFKAAENINLDSVEVVIKVSTEINSEPILAKVSSNTNKKNNNTNGIASIIIPPDEPKEIYGYGSVKIKNNQSRLEIIEPSKPNFIDYVISRVPRMPNVVVKARLKNYKLGAVTFNFILNIQWINKSEEPQRIIQDQFEGMVEVYNSDTAKWTVQWNDLFRGGKITCLIVSAVTTDYQEFSQTINNPFTITGLNPTKQSVKKDLTIQQQVVAYKESRFRQFNNNGFPLWGNPHGYGIMQLDPPDNKQQIWNWHINRAEGIERLESFYNSAIGYGQRLRNLGASGGANAYLAGATDLTTEEQIWKEAFQEYNGGNYWQWVADDKRRLNIGKWVVRSGTSGYGEDAWITYNDVVNGNPPQDW